MKKKIYFIVSSIIQLLTAILIIFDSKEIYDATISSTMETYSIFPIEFQERVINMMNSIGVYFIVVPAIISIITNLIFLVVVFTDKIIKRRSLLIFLSVIGILLSVSIIPMLLSIINFVLLLSIKKDVVKLKLEEKKIPEVKEKKFNKKEIVCSILIFLFYFSQFVWSDFIPKDNKTISLIISLAFYIIIFVLIFVLFYDKIIDDFKKFIKNFSAFLEFDLPKYGFMILSFLVANLICIFVTRNGTSVNQTAVEALPKLLLFFLAVIWAPVVEEIIFRFCIRNFVQSKWVFILLSAFVFGFLHATGEGSLFEILFTTLPYATLGGWLAYIYYKTDNIVNNIMIHCIWNLFAVIVSLLVSFII